MSLAQIKFDQTGKPAGVAGRAREDLDLGVAVQLTAVGGPFLAQLWTLLDKPNDWTVPARSSAAIVSPNASVTTLQPIDRRGTYFLQLTVDSGLGLGATLNDVARLTFYAGPTLNTTWNALPRRVPAFLERNEHNAPDAIFPTGNARGWAQELEKWFGVVESFALENLVAWGRVTLTGGGAVLVDGRNIATVARTGTGTVDVAFVSPLPAPTYAVVSSARGVLGGSCETDSELTTGFTLFRADPFGSLADADFNFLVQRS